MVEIDRRCGGMKKKDERKKERKNGSHRSVKQTFSNVRNAKEASTPMEASKTAPEPLLPLKRGGCETHRPHLLMHALDVVQLHIQRHFLEDSLPELHHSLASFKMHHNSHKPTTLSGVLVEATNR